MNRREFIQNTLVLAWLHLMRWMPVIADIEEPIELVGLELDDREFGRCFEWGRTVFDGVQAGIEGTFDVKRALDAAYFIDTNGNRYPYREIERIVEAQEAGQPMEFDWGFHRYEGAET